MQLQNFKKLSLVLILLIVAIFYGPSLISGKLPIPADTIVGLYHPWRDVVWDGFVAGVPFKNFLITDPVRQQYPWRQLAMDIIRKNNIPLWNPYTFSGTPLLANFQSAIFYPLNVVFFIFPPPMAWTLGVISQTMLAMFFMYAYLRNLSMQRLSSLLGSMTFAFSGFSIAWLEWNTIVHTILWLPLILLSIDKITKCLSGQILREKKTFFLFFQKSFPWLIVFIFSLSCSLFAGHLQTFSYVLLVSFFYGAGRFYQYSLTHWKYGIFGFIIFIVFLGITSIQWVPTLQFIIYSARDANSNSWMRVDWFIPWQHLIQFIAPDFFGNPSRLNYWGVWNYGEFVGYIGIFPLSLAIFSVLFRRDKKTIFFLLIFILSTLFALPTPLAKLPFLFHIPLLSTAQPSRLMSLIDFSLAILAAFGLDILLSVKIQTQKYRRIFFLLIFILLLQLTLYTFATVQIQKGIHSENFTIGRRNLYLPMIFVTSSLILMGVYAHLRKRVNSTLQRFIPASLLLLTLIDLLLFGWRFISFSNTSWLFPPTRTIAFLKAQKEPYRYMSTDSRIFPPNFSTAYKIQTVDGYDPLYLKVYGEYISTWVNGNADGDISGFNRIITPQKYESRLADLANVRYVLSLKEETSNKLKLVFTEGETKIYENTSVLPRSFFVNAVKIASTKKEALEFLLDEKNNLKDIAVVEEKIEANFLPGQDRDSLSIQHYSENRIALHSFTSSRRFMVLTDSYYPSWEAKIDGIPTKIYRADYAFRGIIIPPGEHNIEFKIGKLFTWNTKK